MRDTNCNCHTLSTYYLDHQIPIILLCCVRHRVVYCFICPLFWFQCLTFLERAPALTLGST